MSVDIEKLTLGEIRDIARIAAQFGGKACGETHPLIGENVFVRTVTCYYTGHLECVVAGRLALSDAAWIPLSGRWSDALSSGAVEECEPYPDDVICYVSQGVIVDESKWLHDLPRSQR